MVLEWIRRRDPQLDTQLRKYLFTTTPITDQAAAAEGGGTGTTSGCTPVTSSLGIGPLHDKELL